MDDSKKVITDLAARMAARTSRRGFLRLAGTAVVGMGLAMNGVSLANATCSPACNACMGTDCVWQYPTVCSGCPGGSGCPSGYTGKCWICCTNCCDRYCCECCNAFTGDTCHCRFDTTTSCGGCICPFSPTKSVA